jgi:hypothetical protein
LLFEIICAVSRQQLPSLNNAVHMETELDRNIRHYREVELTSMANEAGTLRENATDVVEALNRIDGFLSSLKNMASEVCCEECFYWHVMLLSPIPMK